MVRPSHRRPEMNCVQFWVRVTSCGPVLQTTTESPLRSTALPRTATGSTLTPQTFAATLAATPTLTSSIVIRLFRESSMMMFTKPSRSALRLDPREHRIGKHYQTAPAKAKAVRKPSFISLLHYYSVLGSLHLAKRKYQPMGLEVSCSPHCLGPDLRVSCMPFFARGVRRNREVVLPTRPCMGKCERAERCRWSAGHCRRQIDRGDQSVRQIARARLKPETALRAFVRPLLDAHTELLYCARSGFQSGLSKLMEVRR